MKPVLMFGSLTAVALLCLGGGYLLGKQQVSHAMPETATQTGAAVARKVLYWYDPMSPGQRFDKPGKSPFMDMDLLPRYADEAPSDGGVSISARQQQNLGVRVTPVAWRTLDYQLNAFGTVVTDERNIQVVSARAKGVVEQLLVRATEQQVKKNQPLAVLWFPDWTAAQQEYLAVRQLGDTSLTIAARQRLQLQFMPDDIIRRVEKTGQPQTRITLLSPVNGYVNKLAVREGDQVNASQVLFELASLDPVWLEVNYPQSQASMLSQGSQVVASSESWPGEAFHGQIKELLPAMDTNTRTLKARVVLQNNQQKLRPGMYMQVQLAQAAKAQPRLVIPQQALILTGSRSQVLVAQGQGYFKPVDVVAGQSQDGWIEIKQGLKQGDQVVSSGQFLIDSEASLNSALPQFTSAEMSTASDKPAGYQAQGRLDAIEGSQVTISHGAVAELKWPPMTMDFTLPASGLPSGLQVGSAIEFSFTLDPQGAKITHIAPLPLIPAQKSAGEQP